jgi:ribosomal protein S27E
MEVRCPRCKRILIAALRGWARVYCRHCKEFHDVSR